MEIQTGKDHQEIPGFLTRSITRRQAIKAGGIAVVGLAFSKPLVESVMPKPAFAQYVVRNGGNASIQWACTFGTASASPGDIVDCGGYDDGNDVVVTNVARAQEITVYVPLCDVSDDDPAVPFDAIVTFVSVPMDSLGQFDSLKINGTSVPVGGTKTVPFTVHQECKLVRFDIKLKSGFNDSKELKLKFTAEAVGGPAPATPVLHITLE